VDEPAEIPYKILEFDCDSMAQFYRVYFVNRKIMGMDSQRPETLSYDRQFAIQRDKFNSMNWYESLGIYMVGTDKSRYQVWQPGWVGGSMSGYALMKLGGELEFERQMKTLNFLFAHQEEIGFFQGVVDKDGCVYGDGSDIEGTSNWHLIRKSADVLYFLFKNFRFMQEKGTKIPERFLEGTKILSDAFVNLFDRYGQFGQFVDIHTGEICVGGSVSAGIAPAGLAEAYRFFDEPKYLRAAEESAEYYYQNFLSKGYTTGGPGEILQAADSESGFGLLESFVVLYEVTGEDKWLSYARDCVHYCSSWVVSYNYRFPETCEFYRLNMKTVGTVFANLQNKHSAPGICTLSGDSIYKLWKWTKDPLYLELIKDIAGSISQYMSTDERPIYDWEEESRPLPQGFIFERVNMSDWEGYKHIGETFNGSCWSETSNLLTLAEIVPLFTEDSREISSHA